MILDKEVRMSLSTMQRLGEQVHLLRRRQRLSQKALADAVGASPTTISNLEQGKLGTLHIDHLVALAQQLGVTTDYLLGIEEPARAEPPAAATTAQTTKRQQPRKAASVG
jgi:transcriptional regulator with XRE-family HTH domain